MAYNPPFPGPRPPKRKPRSTAAEKMKKPLPARRPRRTDDDMGAYQKPRPSVGARRTLDDRGTYQKPAPRRGAPSGRAGTSMTPKRKPKTRLKKAPTGKVIPKKLVGFYGQRPSGRGKFGR